MRPCRGRQGYIENRFLDRIFISTKSKQRKCRILCHFLPNRRFTPPIWLLRDPAALNRCPNNSGTNLNAKKKGLITIARKYKQVHSKELTFTLEEWEDIKKRAAECYSRPGTYIRNIAVRGNSYFYDMKAAVPLLDNMRVISTEINQIAKKINATNSLNVGDVEKLKENVSALSSMLNTFVQNMKPVKV